MELLQKVRDIFETQELFQYVEEASHTDRPLILAGFDCQVTGTATEDYFLPDLRAFIRDIGLDTVALEPGTTLAEGIRLLGENFTLGNPALFLAPDSSFLVALAQLRERISSAGSETYPGRTALWLQLLESLASEVPRARDHAFSYDTAATLPERNAAFQRMFNTRDAQMAKNLLWLSDTYFPDHKIIGWLATAHAIHN